MVTSISNAPSSLPLAENASSSAPATIKPVVTPTNNAEDTVELTAAQQATNLYNAGQTIPQIAFTLHLSVDLVNSYLGISSSSQ